MSNALYVLAGVIVGQLSPFILLFWEHHNKKKVFLREKCEKLSACIMASELWFNELDLCYTLDELKKCHPPIEATETATLASLYFPSLADPAAIYSNHLLGFYRWLFLFIPTSPAVTMNDRQSIMSAASFHKDYNQWNGKVTSAKNGLQIALGKEISKYV
jgi:hypothetical protein